MRPASRGGEGSRAGGCRAHEASPPGLCGAVVGHRAGGHGVAVDGAVLRAVLGGALGEAEEEVLEARQLRRQGEDRDAGAPERERHLADVVLLGLELERSGRARRLADPGLGAQQRERALVVGRCAACSACRPGGADRTAPPRRRPGRDPRSPPGRTVPGPRAAGGRRAARSCRRRPDAGSACACRASRPGRARWRARRGSAAAAGAAAPPRSPGAGACRASSRPPCGLPGESARRSPGPPRSARRHRRRRAPPAVPGSSGAVR